MRIMWFKKDKSKAVETEIAQEPLHAVNRDRAVEARPVADALARVIADPAAHAG